MKKRSLGEKLVASPYIVWAAMFIIVPLIFVAYYSVTDANGNNIQVTDNKFLLLLLINIFLLVVGCLVDNIPATIILAPILLPVVVLVMYLPTRIFKKKQ